MASPSINKASPTERREISLALLLAFAMRWKNFVFLSPTSFLKPDPLEILRLQVHSLAPVFHLNRPLLIRSNFFNLFLYTYPVIHFTFLTIKFITIV